MALLQISFFSKCLKRETTFNALLPLDGPPPEGEPPLGALYLLHGYSASYTDWLSHSRIRELSDRYRLAVFMPSGENHFYLDDVEREALYGEFVGRELVEFTRRMFPISHRREDTLIGGLSMGGYGALRNGLHYAETFGQIIALSSAILSYRVADIQPGTHNGIAGYSYYRAVFGELDSVRGSDKDPEALVRRLKASGSPVPEIYMACGTEDFLLDVNRELGQFLKDEGVRHTYRESPGSHTWEFWNDKIVDALEWSKQSTRLEKDQSQA
ncbi:alpha/beta hydrolase [Paenibacillus sp. CAU 1782]